MYEERESMIAGAVAWLVESPGGPGVVLPDGCMDLIWMGSDLVIAGPDTELYVANGRPGDRVTGVRFAPGTLPDLLGVPAAELKNQRVPLADVIGARRTLPIIERIAEADRPDRALEAESAALMRAVPPDERTAAVVAQLRSGRSIVEIADRVNLSERQLRRLGHHKFGYGPKMLGRILRFRQALELAGADQPAADIAAATGYADQAHLIRETKSLTGLTFGALIS